MELGNWKSSPALPDGQARAVLTVANGLTSKEGGRLFGVSPNTINAALNQLREKLNGNYNIAGKRSWIVTECIRRDWLSPLMIFVFIGSVLSSLVVADPDMEMRRTSNRVTARGAASRMVRGRKSRELLEFDFDDITPESMMAFFEGQEKELTAPWSSVALAKDGPLSNSERIELWRSNLSRAA